MNEPLETLADYPVATFMQEDWHVRPKLFRQAFPNMEPLCNIDDMHEMAADEDIETRLIQKVDDQWEMAHGPFEQLPDLNQRNWTVLIQGLDLILPEAQDLLQQFRFIPDARLDDVMLSLASDGGGVGPHFDSYDVFLIQMHGRRRWKIGPLKNKTLVEDSPLKILSDFQPTEEFVLEPGDMLYLPPNYGHDGEAVGVCSTLSVGFRAPSKAEVLSNLLRELADKIEDTPALQDALFSDPKRGLQADPSEIPQDLIDFAQTTYEEFVPDNLTLQRCLGIMLSEPKPTVLFEPESEDLAAEEILDTLASQGIALAMGTRILFAGQQCFVNGDPLVIETKSGLKWLKRLTNEGLLEPEDAALALGDEEFCFFAVGFAKAGWLNTVY